MSNFSIYVLLCLYSVSLSHHNFVILLAYWDICALLSHHYVPSCHHSSLLCYKWFILPLTCHIESSLCHIELWLYCIESQHCLSVPSQCSILSFQWCAVLTLPFSTNIMLSLVTKVPFVSLLAYWTITMPYYATSLPFMPSLWPSMCCYYVLMCHDCDLLWYLCVLLSQHYLLVFYL